MHLADKGADINTKNNENQTALFIASHQGHSEVVKYLKSIETNRNTP